MVISIATVCRLKMAVMMERTMRKGSEKSHVNRKPCLSHLRERTVPSTNASIPGKYQVVFNREDEKRGFTSQTPRFPSYKSTNDNPGPGSYHHGNDVMGTSVASFSRSGMGGFASKSKRFSKSRLSNLGPGSYNPQSRDTRTDFSRGDGSRNFQQPVVSQQRPLPTAPGPNVYMVHTDWDDCSVSAVASFKSRSKRNTFELTGEGNPPPWHYSIKDDLIKSKVPSHSGIFKSKLERGSYIQYNKVPGPGTYSPFNRKQEELEKRSVAGKKHYLCLSAPAVPLPPAPPPPGPGHYEIRDSDPPSTSKSVSDSVFRSSTSRWSGMDADTQLLPGPGAYNPQCNARHSFLYNLNQKWV